MIKLWRRLRMAKKKSIELTLEYMQATLPKNHAKTITQETIDEINALVEDPDYGEHFKESMITSASVLGGKEPWSFKEYMNATKYLSIVALGETHLNAYVKVFPERLQVRLDDGFSKDVCRGEAGRYNSSVLVNALRGQSQVPFHLRNQGAAQDALDQLLHLMMNARSDVAKVSAATAVLKETRPPEVQQVELQLGLSDQALEMQDKQNETLRELAMNQRKLLEQGYDIGDIQKLHVTNKTAIEAEIDE